MEVVRSVDGIRGWRRGLVKEAVVGCVPTMGFLHDGHIALIQAARKQSDVVVVTLFVNPAQFAPGEDFEAYPRDEERDLRICRENGVDCVFAPERDDMFPPEYGTYVTVSAGEPSANQYAEGNSRPTFFRGVATVLVKLFHLVAPIRVYFGQKDAQQCSVVKQLTRDLMFEIEVVVIPTVRETDGLAMSSRNAYLNEAERMEAPALHKALLAAESLWKYQSCRSSTVLKNCMRESLENSASGIRLLYVAAFDGRTMQEFSGDIPKGSDIVIAIAGMLGRTRLIDNIPLYEED